MPALFLTLVRSSLGGLVIGVVFLIVSLKGRQCRNLLVGVMALMLAAVPFALTQETANGVTKRLSSITDLKDDASFEARPSVYDKFFDEMQVNFLGRAWARPASARNCRRSRARCSTSIAACWKCLTCSAGRERFCSARASS